MILRVRGHEFKFYFNCCIFADNRISSLFSPLFSTLSCSSNGIYFRILFISLWKQLYEFIMLKTPKNVNIYFNLYYFSTHLMETTSLGQKALNSSSPKGGCTNPLTVFALVLKIAQPRGKIAPGTFNFILSLRFSEKNFEPTIYTGVRVSFQSWEVRGVGAIPWFLSWIFWKYLKWYALTSLFAS